MTSKKKVPLIVSISVTLIVAVFFTVFTHLGLDLVEQDTRCEFVPAPLPHPVGAPDVYECLEPKLLGFAQSIVLFASVMLIGIAVYVAGLFLARVPLLGSSTLITSLGITGLGLVRYFGNLNELFRFALIGLIGLVTLVTALFMFGVIGGRK